MPGNSLEIGKLVGRGRPVILPSLARARHTYVCGGTGVGKSKFLEHCIRQDILNWEEKIGSGLILFDPHGLVYENVMAWIVKHGLDRPIIPIDLRRDDWIVSYNLLRKRKQADPSVVVGNFVSALAHVWGEAGTDRTPLFARLAGLLLFTLYQNGCTVADVMYLLSRDDVRRAMVSKLQSPSAQHAWRKAEQYPKDFETQITSTLNRFDRLLGPKVMEATLGQPDVSLDLEAAMEEGSIILVNLSTKGGMISEENADTFATLLLSDLWSAAQSRGKEESDNLRPFYVYIDECQKFITPTIADNLDQARGFGLHMTLANQYPRRLVNAGAHGQAMYDSIIANAGNKVVFRLEHPQDTKDLALWLFMNVLDTDEIKHVLYSTKVMGYTEETRESTTTGTSTSEGKSKASGGGSFEGASSGKGESGTDESLLAEAWNSHIADSSGESESWSESESRSTTESESTTTSSMLMPIMGKEISGVQFRTIDEQLFRAMQTLFDQKDRHFAIRYHEGPKAPLFVKTPNVNPATTSKDLIEKYRKKLLKKIAFALPMPEATKRRKDREQKLLTDIVNISAWDEPTEWKRKVK